MIDRNYGHLARDGREHAITLLDTLSASATLLFEAADARGRPVDVDNVARHRSRQPNPDLSRK